MLVSLVLLVPWNTGGLWARPAEGSSQQQEPLLQAWGSDSGAGPLPEALLASDDALKVRAPTPACMHASGARSNCVMKIDWSCGLPGPLSKPHACAGKGQHSGRAGSQGASGLAAA